MKESGADAGGGGESRYVPQREEDSDPGPLPGFYAKIVEFVRDAQEPVRVREVTEGSFGQRANRSLQKGVRCQVERLVLRAG
ncbi:hypothetical protein [Streptomyces sp. NBC_01716]|uniref:hypothetical protein n=1 Tax=Streptomyces sp. NBC_01716 TaxID=2975917 RepID=UPI002E3639D7|nr:hypothetical protein [Streptomyces sp. NBC_01716]